MALGYDGNAATVTPIEEAPVIRETPVSRPAPAKPKAAKPKIGKRQKPAENAEAAQTPRVSIAMAAPKMVVAILVVAAVIMLMLMSHAQLVMVNDEAVNLRGELSQLQDEVTKLKAQYELTYDLQEIETQMLTSGQMIKIQDWQTFVLELSEPDNVEYFQYKGGLEEQAANFGKNLLEAVKEYF